MYTVFILSGELNTWRHVYWDACIMHDQKFSQKAWSILTMNSQHYMSILLSIVHHKCMKRAHMIFPRALDVLKHKEGAVDKYTFPT